MGSYAYGRGLQNDDIEIECDWQLVRAIEELQHRIDRNTSAERMLRFSKLEPADSRIVSNPSSSVEGKPLNEFRNLPVFPRKQDLKPSHKPTLTPNIARGSYGSLERYLSIWYRLLREDFERPLREQLRILNAPKTNGAPSTKTKGEQFPLFSDARISPPDRANGRVGPPPSEVKFNVKPFSHIDWESSKTLLHRSLLCFSRDDFKSYFFATIVERSTDNLKRGSIKITYGSFVNNLNIHNCTYTFFETGAFFEAYKHVLLALQNIRCSPHTDMPFEQQIVFSNPNVLAPKYIQASPSFDLKCLRRSNYAGNMPLIVSDVRKLNSWPSSDQLTLDECQVQAIKHALTSQVVIIQGPPGTGKTFIALKIVRLLLEKINNDSGNSGPIMVVGYTNHALDQFVEGIAKFMPGGGQNAIVRIGGEDRMKDEVKQFSLRKFMQNNGPKRDTFTGSCGAARGRIHSEATTRVLTQESKNNGCMALDANEVIQLCPVTKTTLFDIAAKQSDLSQGEILVRWLCHFNPLDPPEKQSVGAVARLLHTHTRVPLPICSLAASQFNNADRMVTWTREYKLQMDTNRTRTIVDEVRFGLKLHSMNIGLTNDWLNRKDSYPNSDTDHYGRRQQSFAVNATQDRMKIQWFYKLPSLEYFIKERIAQIPPVKNGDALLHNPWKLTITVRWQLYKFWCLRSMQNKCNESTEMRGQMRTTEDLELASVLATARVVAMTSTGAAAKRGMLQELRPKIVIVEEAAQILEPHVVASLTAGCQHLIMIGDHKQLRPGTAVHELAKNYQLDISLFERLINNGFKHVMLQEQHRMRPEIASLMQHFYDGLRNHSSVYNRSNVRGLTSNVFFVDHSHHETDDLDTCSYKNVHEAKFLVALCKYLLSQGHTANEITILTCYKTQKLEIKRLLENGKASKVEVYVVDEFQGEENEIILLSMVRSNNIGKIGFLGTENRICVALSRARLGLFVIGNFGQLSRESDLWRRIVADLKQRNSIGTSLKIQCRIHKQTRFVMKAEEFQAGASGDCCSSVARRCLDVSHISLSNTQSYKSSGVAVQKTATYNLAQETASLMPRMCNFVLRCGHRCPRQYHLDDPKHFAYKCMRKCQSRCEKFHPCPRMCSENCWPCDVVMMKKLRCGHKRMTTCGTIVANQVCVPSCRKSVFSKYCTIL